VTVGLDTVELVMEIEEAFDITIPDAEAEKILTIGDLYRYVLMRLGGPMPGTSRCLSAATFYRLRRKLMSELRVERRRILPASALDDLIPEADRQADWERLGKSLGCKLPPLHCPNWVCLAVLGLLISWSATVVFVWGLLTGFAPQAAIPGVLVLVFGAILLGRAVYAVTRPLAVLFSTPDIRSLVPILFVSNLATIRGPDPWGWTSSEVWETIIAIVAEQAGVAADQLNESTSFVKDLW
jgi:acyl carrier protein